MYVTGSFDNWQGSVPLVKGLDGFAAEVAIPDGEKVAFKYIVDGRWVVRESERVETDEHGNLNNVLFPEDWRGAHVAEAPSAAPAAPAVSLEPAYSVSPALPEITKTTSHAPTEQLLFTNILVPELFHDLGSNHGADHLMELVQLTLNGSDTVSVGTVPRSVAGSHRGDSTPEVQQTRIQQVLPKKPRLLLRVRGYFNM